MKVGVADDGEKLESDEEIDMMAQKLIEEAIGYSGGVGATEKEEPFVYVSVRVFVHD